MLQPTPLTLYVHFPWCIQKCPYCDFNSHTLRHALPEENYIQVLIRDLEKDVQTNPSLSHRALTSIFMGGGTPSLFSGKAIDQLLMAIARLIPFSKQIEITLEANPASAEHSRFEAYLEAGVNRLSLGIQSFHNRQLKKLGRSHNADTACIAIKQAQQAGFENINLDIMFGLKNQTVEEALDDCKQALTFNTAHLSFYQLTIEPNTFFYKHPPDLPKDDVLLDMQQGIGRLVKQSGFEQYEVSAYALSDRKCRHNLNYWQFGDYLGIGAGAHGKLSNNKMIKRYWKQKRPKSYMQQVTGNKPFLEQQVIDDSSINFEFLLNALRLKHGFNFLLYEQRTGKEIKELLCLLKPQIENGLIQVNDKQIKCSSKGFLFIDEILQTILP